MKKNKKTVLVASVLTLIGILMLNNINANVDTPDTPAGEEIMEVADVDEGTIDDGVNDNEGLEEVIDESDQEIDEEDEASEHNEEDETDEEEKEKDEVEQEEEEEEEEEKKEEELTDDQKENETDDEVKDEDTEQGEEDSKLDKDDDHKDKINDDKEDVDKLEDKDDEVSDIDDKKEDSSLEKDKEKEEDKEEKEKEEVESEETDEEVKEEDNTEQEEEVDLVVELKHSCNEINDYFVIYDFIIDDSDDLFVEGKEFEYKISPIDDVVKNDIESMIEHRINVDDLYDHYHLYEVIDRYIEEDEDMDQVNKSLLDEYSRIEEDIDHKKLMIYKEIDEFNINDSYQLEFDVKNKCHYVLEKDYMSVIQFNKEDELIDEKYYFIDECVSYPSIDGSGFYWVNEELNMNSLDEFMISEDHLNHTYVYTLEADPQYKNIMFESEFGEFEFEIKMNDMNPSFTLNSDDEENNRYMYEGYIDGDEFTVLVKSDSDFEYKIDNEEEYCVVERNEEEEDGMVITIPLNQFNYYSIDGHELIHVHVKEHVQKKYKICLMTCFNGLPKDSVAHMELELDVEKEDEEDTEDEKEQLKTYKMDDSCGTVTNVTDPNIILSNKEKIIMENISEDDKIRIKASGAPEMTCCVDGEECDMVDGITMLSFNETVKEPGVIALSNVQVQKDEPIPVMLRVETSDNSPLTGVNNKPVGSIAGIVICLGYIVMKRNMSK